MSSSDNNNSSILCTFPYEMYSIDTQFGLWRPCPRIDYQKVEDSNFNNHERLIQLRQNLRAGVKDELCSKCWNDEEKGTLSYRQVLKQDKLSKNSKLDEIPAPKIFEIKFSNICNLKCVFCSSLCSSLWEKDQPLDPQNFGSIRGKTLKNDAILFLERNIEDIEVIQLFGGEPLLHPEFYEVLDFLIEQPNPGSKKTISFSTNFFFGDSIYKKFENRLKSLLDQGYKFYLRLSIDGIEDRGEYLRTGLNWQSFDSNFKKLSQVLKQYENPGRVRCNIALNILNLLSLDQIMKYLHESEISEIEPHYNYIGKPERFTLQSFGTRLKRVKNTIEKQNFYGFEKYQDHVVRLVNSICHRPIDQTAISECQNWLSEYDKKQGKTFLKVFPENSYMFEIND